MNFKKLALASAVVMVPSLGLAMEEMEDATMSDVTGQDGIRMVWSATSINMDIGIHDKDGLTGLGLAAPSSGYTFDGGIFIDNMSMGFSGGITIDIDAGNNVASGTGSTLNVKVTLPSVTSIATGAISVGNSQRDESGWLINNLSGTIIETATIVLGTTSLNIQLGSEPQGNMIAFNSTVTSGITINNFSLNDASVAGAGIRASSITILDNGGTNLSLNVGMNVTGTGLQVTLGHVGSSTSGMDIRIIDQRLGSATAGILGDISITGLNINNTTLQISGK